MTDEIIKCKDCKHWEPHPGYTNGTCTGIRAGVYDVYLENCEDVDTDDNFFCGNAKRRDDG